MVDTYLFVSRNKNLLILAGVWLVANILVFTFSWLNIAPRCDGVDKENFTVIGSFDVPCQESFGACCKGFGDQKLDPYNRPCEFKCGDPCNMIGRVLGHTLNFNMGLILLPVARNSVWTRLFGISFERAVVVHRLLGGFIFFTMLFHLVAWWWAYPPFTQGWLCWAITYELRSDMFTGELVFIFHAIAALFALEYFRRNRFELFFYAHHLYIPVYVFAIIHTMGTQKVKNALDFKSDYFIYYFVIPGSLFVADYLLRVFQARIVTSFRFTDMSLVPGGVVSLRVKERAGIKGFQYEPGQYCFVNIPKLSPLQWHPFSISSSPADGDTFTFHIKSMGDNTWTSELSKLAKIASKNPSDVHSLKVMIEGPYGHFQIQPNDFPVVAIIAGGIGVTPMMSLFKDFIQRPHKYPNVKSLHFYWTFRELNQVNWFPEVWKQLFGEKKINTNNDNDDDNSSRSRGQSEPNVLLDEDENSSNRDITIKKSNNEVILKIQHITIVIHCYVTHLKYQSDNDEKETLVMNTVSTSQIPEECYSGGRINWNTVRKRIADDNSNHGDVGLFVCGPEGLIDDCYELATDCGWKIHTETFFL